jgi:hypothetical protein
MSESEDLEAVIRRPDRRFPESPRSSDSSEPLGQCDCGARITAADLYGAQSDADLGRPRRLPAPRVLRYRCPLCGQTGELGG